MECGALAVAAAVCCAQSPRLPKRRLNCRRSTSRLHSVSAHASNSGNAADNSESITSTQGAIQLEFIGPSNNKEDSYTTSVPSGEKILRNVMLDTKLELYGLYGKVMNCGGVGNCGTCTVEILEGQELLSELTDAEKRHLKKKPANWRLACQTILGNKSNSGKVVVQRLPQQKKN